MMFAAAIHRWPPDHAFDRQRLKAPSRAGTHSCSPPSPTLAVGFLGLAPPRSWAELGWLQKTAPCGPSSPAKHSAGGPGAEAKGQPRVPLAAAPKLVRPKRNVCLAQNCPSSFTTINVDFFFDIINRRAPHGRPRPSIVVSSIRPLARKARRLIIGKAVSQQRCPLAVACYPRLPAIHCTAFIRSTQALSPLMDHVTTGRLAKAQEVDRLGLRPDVKTPHQDVCLRASSKRPSMLRPGGAGQSNRFMRRAQCPDGLRGSLFLTLPDCTQPPVPG